MKLPSQKKILREDLRDAPPWITNVIDPVNSFMESVYQALNKNITVTENISSFIQELNYTTTSAYPTATPIFFKNTLKSRAIGVLVLQAYDKTTYTPAPGPVYVPWVEVNTGIEVLSITGLEASKSYLIRLLIF